WDALEREADDIVGSLDQGQAAEGPQLVPGLAAKPVHAVQLRAAMVALHEVELFGLGLRAVRFFPLRKLGLELRIPAEPGQDLALVIGVGVGDLAGHGAAALVLAADVAR